MVRDGIYYLIGFTLAFLGVAWIAGPAPALPLLFLGLFCGWFFRDPERPIPAGPVAVSPADGQVVSIVPEDGRMRVSIFLNVFDVHVNRAPISGVLTDVTYCPGKFLVASREVASAENEQTILTIRANDGTVVVFKQIAGLIARRIVCPKKSGDFVQAGERIGMIKFGSRCDVIFGPEWRVEVTPGMRVSAGSSILARRGGAVEIPLRAAVGVKEATAWQT